MHGSKHTNQRRSQATPGLSKIPANLLPWTMPRIKWPVIALHTPEATYSICPSWRSGKRRDWKYRPALVSANSNQKPKIFALFKPGQHDFVLAFFYKESGEVWQMYRPARVFAKCNTKKRERSRFFTPGHIQYQNSPK